MLDALHRLAYRLGYRLAKRWWRLTRPHQVGAATALRHGDRVLVVRHSYMPDLGLPAGGLHRGEDAHAAARRELAEEVGIEVPPSALREAFTFAYEAHGRQVTNWVFEGWLDDMPLPRVDRREIVWAGWRPIQDLAGEPCNPNLRRYLAWCVNDIARTDG